jgi:hypothetical protein
MKVTPFHALAGFCLFSFSSLALAQDANEVVRKAVQSELSASRSDHTRWRYRDEQRVEHTVSVVVETDRGSVKRLVEKDGHPLSEAEQKTEEDRIQSLIHDPAKMAKQQKDSDQDDKNATELLNMLPTAFTWRVVSDAGQTVTLAFAPNPNFHPPDMQSRVLGAMGGELVIDKRQQRIRTIKGTLLQDVMIGYGILGRLHQGGTFDVERREVKPGLWQITETLVNINGKALFFKSISEHQDEHLTEFRVVPGSNTLEQAAELSKRP